MPGKAYKGPIRSNQGCRVHIPDTAISKSYRQVLYYPDSGGSQGTEMTRTSLALILALFASAAFADGFELRGIKVGAQFTREELKAAWGCFPEEKALCSAILAGHVADLTPSTARMHVWTVGATFDNDGFEDIDRALTAKYGKPREERSTAQNAFGAKFVQIAHFWELDGQEMTMQKFATATKAALYICAKEQCEEQHFKERAARDKI